MARNVCPNPSVEQNLDGWSAIGGTLERSSVNPRYGSFRARFTATESSALSVAFGGPVEGSEAVVSLTGPPNNSIPVGGNASARQRAQSFTLDVGSDVSRAALALRRIGDPADAVIVEVHGDGGDRPDGVALAVSDPVAAATIPTADTWVTFSFPDPPALAGATKYWLVARRTGPYDGTHVVHWRGSNANPWAGHGLSYLDSLHEWTAEDGANDALVELFAPTLTISHLMPISAGQTIRGTVEALGDAGVRLTAALELVDGDFARLAITASPPVFLGSWQMVPMPLTTAPAGTRYAIARFTVDDADAAVGVVVALDGLDVRIDEPVRDDDPYLDGDQPGCRWLGPAHASASERLPRPPAVSHPRWASGGVQVEAFLYRADAANRFLEELTGHLVSGTVDWNADRAAGVKLSAQIVIDDRTLFDPYVDYFAPVLRHTWADGVVEERQLGLFIADWPRDTLYAERGFAAIAGLDPTWRLLNAPLRDTWNVGASDLVTEKVAELIVEAGWERVALAASERTFGEDRSFFPPRRRYAVAAEVLEGMGWYHPHVDLAGTITSRPIVDLAAASPALTITRDDLAAYGGELPVVEVVPTTTTLANVIVVAKEGFGDGEPIVAIAENTDPSSPMSIARRGEIVRELTNPQITTQAEADALALATLKESSSFYRVIALQLPPGLWMEPYQVVDTALHSDAWGCLCGRYHVRQWSIGFTPDEALIEVELNRWLHFTHEGETP